MRFGVVQFFEGHRWVWIDLRIGRFWYVLQWHKGHGPFLYRSTDATPPAEDNEGRMLFGRYSE